ncbi:MULTISPECIES: cell envelope integrity protein TolA [Halomonadaceae]|uniref:Cell envelope integrity protein TolA n=1 Tax=Halomonas sulfidivorans TaxID=2733488 RepID=A0ABX7WEA3_9GAMM|nr:cell envelope integrity protein TolA [Halomonas sulfidivorans]
MRWPYVWDQQASFTLASITQSSGNADVDRSVLLAVEAAAPFPKIRQLPAGIQQDYRQFNLRFAPGDPG